MTTADRLANDYLDRLAALTVDLPSDLRDDVLADVRSHLDEARAAAPSDLAFRETLDRLGSPETIAAEARAGVVASTGAVPDAGAVPSAAGGTGSPPPPPPSASGPRVRGRDVTAVLLILGGGVLLLPILGPFALIAWIVGIALVWASPTWTVGEKTLASLVWPGGLLLPAALALIGGETCTSVEENGVWVEQGCTGFSLPTWIGVPLLVVTVVAPVVVAIVLLRRGNARGA